MWSNGVLWGQVEQCKAVEGDTVVFAGPPPTEQKLWPAHCIQGSWGSELHRDLKVRPPAKKLIQKYIIKKMIAFSYIA